MMRSPGTNSLPRKQMPQIQMELHLQRPPTVKGMTVLLRFTPTVALSLPSLPLPLPTILRV